MPAAAAHVAAEASWPVLLVLLMLVLLLAVSSSLHHSHTRSALPTALLDGAAGPDTLTRSLPSRTHSAAHAADSACDTDTTWSLGRRTGRCGHSNQVAFAWIKAAFDAIAGRKEGVEALYKAWVPPEEGRDALYDARRVDRLALELVPEAVISRQSNDPDTEQ